jgi:hypothetical protein
MILSSNMSTPSPVFPDVSIISSFEKPRWCSISLSLWSIFILGMSILFKTGMSFKPKSMFLVFELFVLVFPVAHQLVE